MKKDDPSMAEMLGNGYAHVQHIMDKAIAWGFTEMRKAAASKPTKTEQKTDTAAAKAAYAARSTFKFFGEAGEAYYRKYEELKRKKQ